MNKVKTVLFLGWSTKGRDIEIDLPLMYFFEKILKWQVIHHTIFNLPKVLKTKPDLVLMTNSTGGFRQIEVSRLIENSGFPFFSHVSEGMFRESDIEEFVWGWGRNEKRMSENLSMLWSQKAYDMAVSNFPGTAKKFRISGGVGFDKYKILRKTKLNSGKYEKCIGYAAFDFHNIVSRKERYIENGEGDAFKQLMSLAVLARNILHHIVKNNPDILFFLKQHPGDGENCVSLEFQDISNYDNIRIVKSDVSIVDVISSSDIWLNINSSTNLEAWLMGKPSISFLTNEEGFSSDVINGSIIENDCRCIQNYIEEYYLSGCIQEFDQKKHIREKLISEYIGFSDGLNHVRYMSFLKPFIENSESGLLKTGSWKISLKWRIKCYLQHLLYLISKRKYKVPFVKKWAEYYDIYDAKELTSNKIKYYEDMHDFYKSNHGLINSLYENYSKASM